jgi:hypothetical protein
MSSAVVACLSMVDVVLLAWYLRKIWRSCRYFNASTMAVMLWRNIPA